MSGFVHSNWKLCNSEPMSTICVGFNGICGSEMHIYCQTPFLAAPLDLKSLLFFLSSAVRVIIHNAEQIHTWATVDIL